MFIFGAGMAGLIAGNMLRRFDPVIYEYQSELPNNHAALLRFRTDSASKVTNLPFKKVNVQKAIRYGDSNTYEPNLFFSNMYSQKVSGKVMGRSIKNLDPVERYIAPPDYISQMAKSCTIKYNSPLTLDFLKQNSDKSPIISTIPMPSLMDMVGWKDKPEFEFLPIWSVVGTIKHPTTDVYQTIYFPGDERFYRASITGNQFICEYISEPGASLNLEFEAASILHHAFGIDCALFDGDLTVKEQKFGKLMPVDEQARKEFILYMTDNYRVYSLGRFATWRQLLMDDVVEDVKVIEKLVSYRNDYERKLVSSGIK